MVSDPAGVPGIDLAALARYLPTVLDDYDPAAGLSARLLAGGRSNLTCLISQPGGQPGSSPERQWVLRRPPLGHVMPSAHDMVREFRILSELDGTGFPAPRPRALCTDHSVLGVTFLVYDYVPGLVISDEATAARLTAAHADAVRSAARHHAGPAARDRAPAGPARPVLERERLPPAPGSPLDGPVAAHGDQGPPRVPATGPLAAGRGQRPHRGLRGHRGARRLPAGQPDPRPAHPAGPGGARLGDVYPRRSAHGPRPAAGLLGRARGRLRRKVNVARNLTTGERVLVT